MTTKSSLSVSTSPDLYLHVRALRADTLRKIYSDISYYYELSAIHAENLLDKFACKSRQRHYENLFQTAPYNDLVSVAAAINEFSEFHEHIMDLLVDRKFDLTIQA